MKRKKQLYKMNKEIETYHKAIKEKEIVELERKKQTS